MSTEMQSVNLYLPELQPSKEWLTARSFVATLFFFVVFLVVLQVASVSKTSALEDQVVDLELRQMQMTDDLKKLKSIPKKLDAAKIDEELKNLKSAVASRKNVGEIIEGQSFGNAQGFSLAMESLARQSSAEVSISHFRLSDGGSMVELAGEVLAPEALPHYIDRLRTEDSFSSATFGRMHISEGERKSRFLTFNLGFSQGKSQQGSRRKLARQASQ